MKLKIAAYKNDIIAETLPLQAGVTYRVKVLQKTVYALRVEFANLEEGVMYESNLAKSPKLYTKGDLIDVVFEEKNAFGFAKLKEIAKLEKP